jgi:CheY-like chemotaxis protein
MKHGAHPGEASAAPARAERAPHTAHGEVVAGSLKLQAVLFSLAPVARPIVRRCQEMPWARSRNSIKFRRLMPRPILVVEDDADIRELMGIMLEGAGHVVVTASNGMQAFNLAQEHQPGLILLDLMMPVMGGEEFRRAQLASKFIKRIPVVVLSAHPDARSIARRMKAVACLTKPLDFDALLTLCARQTLRD